MITWVSIVLSVFSLGLSVFIYRKWGTVNDMISEEGEKIAEAIAEELAKTLEPMHKAVSHTMGLRSEKGVQARQLKKVDRLIAEDIINQQDPLIQGALDMFPQLRDYISSNPKLIPQLLPRLQALASMEGGINLSSLSSPPSKSSSPHPFGVYNEE